MADAARTADATGAPPAPPVLAEAVRSGRTESVHRGSLVVLGAGGGTELALGDVSSPLYPRSANKPMQAAAVLRAGARLAGERLALAAGSHSGERRHLDLVRRMLAEAGLAEAALGTPPDLPLDPAEARAHLAAGGAPDPLAMNCSGKHAAMLTACVAAGWPVAGYLDPGHPLQRLVREEVEAAAGTGDGGANGTAAGTGRPPSGVPRPGREAREARDGPRGEGAGPPGVDGCGAPLFAVSLTGLARAFRSYVLADPGSPQRRVADAMRAHPEYVAGTRRHDTWLMRGVPGALSKVGAEAVQAVALPDGRALAFKVADGNPRAVGPVLARALRLAGVAGPAVDRIADAPLLGGGRRVGEIRAAF